MARGRRSAPAARWTLAARWAPAARWTLAGILVPGILALAACSGDDQSGIDDVVIIPDANPGCLQPTSVLPTEWRPIAAVAAGVVDNVQPGEVVVDGTAGGLPNAPDNPYLYLRFERDTVDKVDITDVDALTSGEWDLAVKRMVFRVNGGDSGLGGRTVASVPGTDPAQVDVPEDAAFTADDWVSDDCVYQGGLIGEPSTAVGVWYKYDLDTSVLTPVERVFEIRRPSGATFALHIGTYYHDSISASYELQWARL